MTVFIAVIALFIVQFSVGYFFSQNERSDQILGWYGQVFEIFDKSKAGGNAANSFAQGHLFLPNSQSEILFGSGFDTSDYLNGQGSDSGVIKNIFSFGIILTFVFYFLMGFKIYTSNKSKHIEETLLTLGLLAVLIIGEVKEPFLLKTFLAKLIFITVIGRNIFYRNKMMF